MSSPLIIHVFVFRLLTNAEAITIAFTNDIRIFSFYFFLTINSNANNSYDRPWHEVSDIACVDEKEKNKPKQNRK